jgi:hypothetical protein
MRSIRLLPAALTLLAAGCMHASTPAAAPDIVSRATWGAHDPVLPMTQHEITRITVHHTGVKSDASKTLEVKLRGLQNFSQNPGKLASGKDKAKWADIPYHYYIDITGRIGEGREWRYVGDTNTSYDPTGHFLIVVEGNFENEQPTPEQLKSLDAMVRWAAERFHVPAERIAAHRDFAQTDCPGENLYARLPELRKAVSR